MIPDTLIDVLVESLGLENAGEVGPRSNQQVQVTWPDACYSVMTEQT